MLTLDKIQIAENRSKVVFGVDDSPESLSFLSMTLLSEGYNFVAFSSGRQCLDVVRRIPPRLILLDIQMPDLDGFETCRQLRKISELENVPIAFLTACKTREDVKLGMAAGGNDFIVKPFDRDQLLGRIRHWTSTRVSTPETTARKNTAA